MFYDAVVIHYIRRTRLRNSFVSYSAVINHYIRRMGLKFICVLQCSRHSLHENDGAEKFICVIILFFFKSETIDCVLKKDQEHKKGYKECFLIRHYKKGCNDCVHVNRKKNCFIQFVV